MNSARKARDRLATTVQHEWTSLIDLAEVPSIPIDPSTEWLLHLQEEVEGIVWTTEVEQWMTSLCDNGSTIKALFLIIITPIRQ